MYLNLVESDQLNKIFTKLTTASKQEASAFINSMLHYETHHGIHHLVKCFKHLKGRFLEIDDRVGVVEEGKIQSKRSEKVSGSFSRGSRVTFIRMLMKIYIRQGLSVVLKILSWTGRWEAKPPTRKDFTTFAHSVAKRPSSNPIPQINTSLIDEGILRDAVTCSTLTYRPLNADRTHILADGEKSSGPTHISKEMFMLASAGQLYRDHEPYLASIFGLEDPARKLLWDKSLLVKGKPIIGRIAGLTGDGSLKIRMIANLAMGWQVAISPLYKALSAFLKVQPESSLYSQDEGTDWMAEQLRRTDVFVQISSIDIVNSTDNLERRFYEKVLDQFIEENFHYFLNSPYSSTFTLFVQAYLLDKDLCQRGWYSTPYSDVSVHYRKGQAMGRLPSKVLLDFTMLLMARSCGANGNNCRINGDDFFTTDNKVARRFKRLLERHNIPVSEPKSFFYKRFGEFSGRLVNAKDGIIPVFKGRKIHWSRDPFGSIRQYGKAGLQLIPNKIRFKVGIVASVTDERELSEFHDQVPCPIEGFEPSKRTPLIEKSGWDKLWVEQVFVEHTVQAQKELVAMEQKMLRNARRPRMGGRRSGAGSKFARSYKTTVEQNLRADMDQLDELRMHTIFKSVALKRFSEPTQKLDLFIDNLNSSIVKTSDGHKIRGYGKYGYVWERLMQAKPVATTRHSKDSEHSTERKFNWVESVFLEIASFFRWLTR